MDLVEEGANASPLWPSQDTSVGIPLAPFDWTVEFAGWWEVCGVDVGRGCWPAADDRSSSPAGRGPGGRQARTPLSAAHPNQRACARVRVSLLSHTPIYDMANFYELEYANRDGLALYLDVTIPDKATSAEPAPVLVSRLARCVLSMPGRS